MAAKVCPCPRCETLESSASQNVTQKHVNFTQKVKHSILLFHAGGDLGNDEAMADQLMKLTRLSLKVLQSSNSSANFQRLSGQL
ncbi:hypothetical protein LSAT2_009472 [Lamellibrachia satsuma]|nr:hypothetical protein LSAT2_009472 [Lamellibrachia satsuma]